MPTTLENLQTAFAGESQANRKYLAYATKAEQEGHGQIARLFRAAADAETIHANYHLRNMDGVGSTLENLKAAIAGETYEHEEMYPPMVLQAEKEGHRAERQLAYARDAEKVHADLFTQALKALEGGADLSQMEVYLCPVCGHLEFGKPDEPCPICGTKAEKYVSIA